jgi:hypothetical protein
MLLALRLRLLLILSRVLCPGRIDPPRHDTPMGLIRVPDFVEDNLDNDAWMQMVNNPDTIANARGFLEEVYRK